MHPIDRHLIAVDLDDTILSGLFSLNVDSVWKLIDLRDKGHIVMIATARPTCMALPYHRIMGLNALLSTVNGNYLFHPDDAAFPMIRHEISEERADAILRTVEELKLLSPWMQSDDSVWTTDAPLPYPYFRLMFSQCNTQKVGRLPVQRCGRIFAMAQDAETANEVMRRFDGLSDLTCSAYPNKYGAYSVSFCASTADKWHTVREAAEYYNIDPQNIWCFGDQNNDRMMITNAHHGYVMKNGNPDLIRDMAALGKGVTRLPCDEGGVGDILSQLL
ncbi:MAG: HAD family phosphatase [Clostridiales bacterium]|nr:HAD family phosphatase [Clostridiales bacterium]